MWFSAMIRMSATVGGEVTAIERSVFIFEAQDQQAARSRALELGHEEEVTSTNVDGAALSWRLVVVETLDSLEETLKDGHEVFWERLPYDGAPLPDGRPEDYRPGSAGISA